jgi:uncharacterized membrane protein
MTKNGRKFKPMTQKKCTLNFTGCLDFYKLFWVFMAFSVVGTISEGIYWILRYGHFDLRTGLIYGPFSPVYGLATTFILLVLYRYRDKSSLFIFLIAYVIAVCFEFTCSVMQQWVFGYTSWDYTGSKLALFGRANLLYAIPWALFGLLLIRSIYPWFCKFLSRFPRKPGVICTWIVLSLMLVNATISAAAVFRYAERQQDIPASNFIKAQLDLRYTDAFMEQRFARLEHITAKPQEKK